MLLSTFSGSTRWSNAMKKIGASGCGELSGYVITILGGSVLNIQVTASAKLSPLIDLIPAGTVTRYSVAFGRRSISSESYSKVRVLVPNQRQVPGKGGSIFTGTSITAMPLNVPRGTMD